MIQRVRLLTWGGAVPPEVGSARGSFVERRGALLIVIDEDGRAALGEATPLPDDAAGVHACQAAIAAFDWRRAQVPADTRALAATIEEARLPPAAAFAVDAALAALAAERARTSLAGWLTAGPLARVPRSVYVGLIGAETTRERATRALARGISTLKLKAPCRDVDAEARWLVALRAAIGPLPKLRIDCNGALAPTEAPAAIEAFARAGLELVEEPCAHGSLLQLGALAAPWFADESFARPELRAALLAHSHVAGVVLKPTAIGGLVSSLRLAEQALAAGKQVIVTHAFEGPVALAACAELALALGARALAPGLDRHAALAAFPELPLAQLPPDSAFVETVSGARQGMGGLETQLGNYVTKLPGRRPGSGQAHDQGHGPIEETWSWTR